MSLRCEAIMLRAKFIPLVMPVVVGAAFLWYRSRRKPVKANEDVGLKNAGEFCCTLINVRRGCLTNLISCYLLIVAL